MNAMDWRIHSCAICGDGVMDPEFCSLCNPIDARKTIDALVPEVYKETVKSSLPEFVRGARVKRK